MPEEIQPNKNLYGAGQKRRVNAGDFDDATLTGGEAITVWSRKVPEDKILWHGHGPQSRSVASAFVDLDLVASGNGAGAAGDNIEGELVLAISDSEQRLTHASGTFEDISQLRDAQSEDRSDRPVMDAHEPFARPGRHLELRVRADDSVDGYEIDSSASSGVVYHSETSN